MRVSAKNLPIYNQYTPSFQAVIVQFNFTNNIISTYLVQYQVFIATYENFTNARYKGIYLYYT